MSALPVFSGTHVALQTLSIMAHKPPEGPGVLDGKECKVQYLVWKRKRRLFHLFQTSERRVSFLLVMKESLLGTNLFSHCRDHTVGHAGKGQSSHCFLKGRATVSDCKEDPSVCGSMMS
jgi:hypothetical protein